MLRLFSEHFGWPFNMASVPLRKLASSLMPLNIALSVVYRHPAHIFFSFLPLMMLLKLDSICLKAGFGDFQALRTRCLSYCSALVRHSGYAVPLWQFYRS